MSRILLVCPERLGPGLPAGVGIRFIEFAGVLLADGHDVTVMSADGGAVSGCETLAASSETIRKATAVSDVAVVQGHIANELFAHGSRIPTVVDLYDPWIIENIHYFAEHGRQVFDHDHATLMASLAHADFFLCASEAQRLFYLGLLVAARRLNPGSFDADNTLRSLVDIASFGVPPKRVVPDKTAQAPALLFGGIYDWYDPEVAIEAVVEARETIPDLTITFTRHPNADTTPQSVAAQTERLVETRDWGSFVRFESWVPYSEREAFYDQFTAAILTFPSSVETDLAMRTRVLDYLWAGLPVISSPGRGTDELLTRYHAGTIVDGDSNAFTEAILSVLGDPNRLRSMVDGASTFADDFQWSKTLEPLRQFCQAPRFDETRAQFADGSAQRLVSPATLASRIRRRLGGSGS